MAQVHGFDSFEGLPEAWREGRGGGFFDRGGQLPQVAPNVRLHAGWFDATLPAFLRSEANAAAAEATADVEPLAPAAAEATTNASAAPRSAQEEAAAAGLEAAVAALRVAFVHVDCDLYSSTRTVLTLLAPAIRAGTVLVFDEWCGYEGWEEHEARAWAEFCAEFRVSFEWIAPLATAGAGKPQAGANGDGGGHSRAVVVTGIRAGAGTGVGAL